MALAARTPAAALVRYAPLAQTLGLMLFLFGLSIVFPLALSHFLADGAEAAYDEALVFTAGCGALLWLVARRHEGELQIRDGFLLVALTWTLLPAFATLPLMLYLPELSFTDAYFEAVSGLTASGATVLDGAGQAAAVDQSLAQPSSSGWAGWAWWCSRSRSCRSSASAARRSSRPRRPGR